MLTLTLIFPHDHKPHYSNMTPTEQLRIDFGLNLKKLRKERDITQELLAQLCDCSTEGISHIERGIHGPRFGMLYQLSKALNIPIHELFKFGPTPSQP
jgi:putative transcriptional regulator